METPVFPPSYLEHCFAFKQETVRKSRGTELLLRAVSREVSSAERVVPMSIPITCRGQQGLPHVGSGQSWGSGGLEVGMNARRLFFFLQI